MWSVRGKGVSSWSRQICVEQLCYSWGGGLVGHLRNEFKMIVVESHVSVQSLNILSFLSLHKPGRDLRTKCFGKMLFRLHSTVTSSVQRFRSCWSDFVVFSDRKAYLEDSAWKQSPCYNMVHECWFSSQVITFNTVLHLSWAALQLLLLSEIKEYVPVFFPFLLFSVLLGICFVSAWWLKAVAPLQPWRFPGSSGSSMSLSLGFLLFLEQHLTHLLPPVGFSIPGSLGCLPWVHIPVLWAVLQLFSAWLSHLSLSQGFSLPRFFLIMYLFALLLPERTVFDLFISKSIALSRHVPWDPVSQANRPITDPPREKQMLLYRQAFVERKRFIFAFGKIFVTEGSLLKLYPTPAAV